MIPLLLAGAAAILLAGCSKDKDKEDKETPKLAKQVPPEPFRDVRQSSDITFFSVSQHQLWHDTNADGKQDPQEKITLLGTESPLDAARRFISKNPAVKPACNPGNPVLLPGSVEQIFDHPEKTRIARRLDGDIAALEGMSQRPPYFDGLLNDLKLIREELPHVRFFYAKAGEVPPGFIGIYDDLAGEMVVTRGAPMSLMVHEMDHRVTAHQRVESYSVPLKVLCSDGVQRSIPKLDYLPDPGKVKTGFSFSLDFFARGQNELTYQDLPLWQPLLDYVATGIEPCLTPENKAAALANEVIAYQTMARYLILETGFDVSLVSDLRSGKAPEQSRAKQKLKAGLERHLSGTNLNPAWANDLMLHYFGIGGLSGHENLTTFVNRYYTAQQAPGFVDPPNCGKR